MKNVFQTTPRQPYAVTLRLNGGSARLVALDNHGVEEFVYSESLPDGQWLFVSVSRKVRLDVYGGAVGRVDRVWRVMMQTEEGLTMDVPFLNLRAEDVERAVEAARAAEASAVRSGEYALDSAASAQGSADSSAAAKQALDDLKTQTADILKEFERRVDDAVAVATNRAEMAANAADQSAANASATLAQCEAIKAEILSLIETGAVGDAITAATGTILEQILTNPVLTARFVTALLGNGTFIPYAKLGRALTVNPAGSVDVDLSNYTGTSVSLVASGAVVIRSSTTASLTLTGGSTGLYGETSVNIVRNNSNKIDLYDYGSGVGDMCSIVSNVVHSRGISRVSSMVSATDSGSNVPSVSMTGSSLTMYHPVKITARPAIS